MYDSKAKNEYLIGKKLKATSMLKDNPIVVVERKCEIKTKAVDKIVKNYSECQKEVDRKRVKKRLSENLIYFSKYYQSLPQNNIFTIMMYFQSVVF